MFTPNHNSHYKIYANKTLDWLPMDTKELYEKNLKENYESLKQNNWIDKSFTYKFNSHGFRCEEFTAEPTMMFLGCSFTCGTGLPIESIWPELVSKKLNMRCANLGQSGGSNDSSFRLCHGWIDIIKPQIVVLLNPPGIRLEIIDAVVMRHLYPTWIRNTSTAYKDFLKDWIRDDNNNYFNKLKNSLAIENLCKERNIKFVFLEGEELTKIQIDLSKELGYLDRARDLAHRGILSNKNFAEYALTKL
jgi:hypothetical protein